MKNLILIILLKLLSFTCNAQKRIQYVFPSKVEVELINYIEKYHLKEPKKLFYIVFDKLNNKDFLISIMSNEKKIDKKTDKLLKQTNRFVILGHKKIPIIFMSDTDFLFLGRDDRGRLKRRAVMYHGFEVIFTYDGEIIKTSQLRKAGDVQD